MSYVELRTVVSTKTVTETKSCYLPVDRAPPGFFDANDPEVRAAAVGGEDGSNDDR